MVTASAMKVVGYGFDIIQWAVNAEIMIFSIVLGPIYTRGIA